MKQSPEATYERARRLANLALWTISLQCRRLQTIEPEDEDFIFRKWADVHFLIVALTRLRRAALLATKVTKIKPFINEAIKEFDYALPNLKTMRDVAEHIDDYAIDSGRKKQLDRKSLEVSMLSNTTFEWLGFKLDFNEALKTSQKLFNTIKKHSLTNYKKMPDEKLI